MKKNIIITIIAGAIIAMMYYVYVLGYYNGASKSILFCKKTSATYNLGTLHYIKVKEYKRANSVLRNELDAAFNAINATDCNIYNPITLLNYYKIYEGLSSLWDYNTPTLIKQYERFKEQNEN